MIVRWETPQLVNNALLASPAVPATLTDEVLKALQALGSTSGGKKILRGMSIRHFEGAGPRTYDPVRQFLAEFSANVRSPESNGTRS